MARRGKFGAEKRQKELKKKKKKQEKLEKKRLKRQENAEGEPEKGGDESKTSTAEAEEPATSEIKTDERNPS